MDIDMVLNSKNVKVKDTRLGPNTYRAMELFIRKYNELKSIQQSGKNMENSDEYFLENAKRIIEEVKYPSYWVDFLTNYFKTNKLKIIKYDMFIKNDPRKNEILVKIYKNTTKEEYLSSWQEINALQKTLSEGHKPIQINPIGYFALFAELYGNKAPREIALILQLAENEYSASDENIRQLMSRTRRKLKL